MRQPDRRIELTLDEIAILRRPVNGDGGFQSLLRSLQRNLDRKSGILTVTGDQFDRIVRYTGQYGWGGFEGRLEAVCRSYPRFFE